MATTADLSSAAEAYQAQQQLVAAAVAAAASVRPQTPERIAQIVAAYQYLAAQQAAADVAAILAQQGISSSTVASVVASSLAGYTSAGLPLATMFESYQGALQLAMLVATSIQDAGRSGASLAMVVSPSADGYVRMLNPPSCSRCVILAGKFFKWNQGFERHPNCDCRHIPTSENAPGDLRTDPRAYFDSLPTAAELDARHPNLTRNERRSQGIYSQEDVFGVAGSAAILDGADMNQVVNARRNGGVQKAQLFGKEAWHTFEGVTRRGLFRQRANAAGKKLPIRLMPESIYALAVDREDALRLLGLYGFIV